MVCRSFFHDCMKHMACRFTHACVVYVALIALCSSDCKEYYIVMLFFHVTVLLELHRQHGGEAVRFPVHLSYFQQGCGLECPVLKVHLLATGMLV